jgi:hypothetical protein
VVEAAAEPPAPVLTQDFSKKMLNPSKLSEWESVAVPAGERRVEARVLGAKGKQYVAVPLDVHVPTEGTVGLSLTIRDDDLELVSD